MDVSFAVAAYMTEEEDPNWVECMYADVNGDKVIDTIDFSILMREYFKR